MAAPAQAACRPTTLADLFPVVPATPPGQASAPVPLVPAPTSTTVPIDPNSIPTTTIPVDPNSIPTTTIPADPNLTTPTVNPPLPTPIPVARCSYVYRMQWPVLGGGAVLSVFGSDRDGGVRHHAGVDISAPKMTPVVAVRDGTVRIIHADGAQCCAVGITHDDGWSSFYLHLNNDVDGSDDGHGFGIRPGLLVGTRVLAGEVIGWVGDSGNAEPATPHLHFELHSRSGVAIDPLASLRWAFRRMPAPALESGPSDFSGPYIDDDGLPAEAMFDLLASLGVMSSCDPWSAAVCPSSEASEVSMRLAGSRRCPGWSFPYGTPTTSTEIIGQILEEALTCPVEGCPPPPVTVGRAAAIVLWVQDQRAHDDALTLIEESTVVSPSLVAAGIVPPPPQPYWLIDPSTALAKLVERGLADDCPLTSPTFDQILTRAGLAEMIGKALAYLPVMECGPTA